MPKTAVFYTKRPIFKIKEASLLCSKLRKKNKRKKTDIFILFSNYIAPRALALNLYFWMKMGCGCVGVKQKKIVSLRDSHVKKLKKSGH